MTSSILTGLHIPMTSTDIEVFQRTYQDVVHSSQFEGFSTDSYLDQVIKKPWGHEYRVYADDFYDVWKLAIAPSQSTSLHCHPRKETALLCLSGTGLVRSLTRTYHIASGEMLFIGKGVFHATENQTKDDLHLIEVELPRNKFDLVRAHDQYGRQHTPYEQKALDNRAPQLQENLLIARSKIRERTLEKQHVFTLQTGRDLMERAQNKLLFLVAIDVGYALQQRIEVLTDKIYLDSNKYYLTISQTEKERPSIKDSISNGEKSSMGGIFA